MFFAHSDDTINELDFAGRAGRDFAIVAAAGLERFGRKITDCFDAAAFLDGADLEDLDDVGLDARFSATLAMLGLVELALHVDDRDVRHYARTFSEGLRECIASISAERKHRRAIVREPESNNFIWGNKGIEHLKPRPVAKALGAGGIDL